MSKVKFEQLILFEDENYIVINKPPFISSLDDRNSSENILLLSRTYSPDTHLCHRLDKETSGCLIIAKSEESYKHAAVQFQERKVTKKYHAFVEGIHDFKEFRVEVPIYIRSGGDARIDIQNGKSATTIFNTLKAYRNQTLIEAFPVTGRLHQIRVHLAYVKAPIVGDIAYGGHPFFLSSIKANFNLGKWDVEQPLIKRFALHAKSIRFNDKGGNEILVEAPYPKDFTALHNQLEKYG